MPETRKSSDDVLVGRTVGAARSRPGCRPDERLGGTVAEHAGRRESCRRRERPTGRYPGRGYAARRYPGRDGPGRGYPARRYPARRYPGLTAPAADTPLEGTPAAGAPHQGPGRAAPGRHGRHGRAAEKPGSAHPTPGSLRLGCRARRALVRSSCWCRRSVCGLTGRFTTPISSSAMSTTSWRPRPSRRTWPTT